MISLNLASVRLSKKIPENIACCLKPVYLETTLKRFDLFKRFDEK